MPRHAADRKSTRLNSSHTEIYTLSLHDALPNLQRRLAHVVPRQRLGEIGFDQHLFIVDEAEHAETRRRSEEHTSELQSHRDLHSFPTRRSSELAAPAGPCRPTSAAWGDWLRPAPVYCRRSRTCRDTP